MAQITSKGQVSPLDLPHFVKARTADGLKRAMWDNNRRLQTFCYYFDISFNTQDKHWYAWFYLNLDKSQPLTRRA